MKAQADFQWQCPVCKHSLSINVKMWACINHHQYDIAKEGYVNLLLANQKNSKAPGDSKEMVAARQAFLASDAYLPLAQQLAQCIRSIFLHTIDLVDLGCSEAYYSATIARMLTEANLRVNVCGVDIAKPAIQKAAKKHAGHHFAVASTFNIPLSDASQDVALQVFAPAEPTEIKRILRTGGRWLLVEPAPMHLFELKAYVYDEPQKHTNEFSVPDGFELEETIPLSFCLTLNTAQMRLDLLKMTPFYWRIQPEKQARLLAGLKDVTADFMIRVMRPL